jgi:hypothetical protein
MVSLAGMRQKILFKVPLFAFVAICCTAIVSSDRPIKQPGSNFPEWIAKEKIRAGFLLAREDSKYASLMRSHGLNTVIAAATLQKKEQFQATFKMYQQWAQTCKRENMHLFVSYWWQPDPKLSSYRRVIYSDGTSGIAPCPRDHEYWHTHLTHLGKVIAALSLESGLQIDGIFLDCELYGPETGKKRHYGRHTCFCDDCFSSFLLAKGYEGKNLPAIRPGEREKWLKENQLLEDYFGFLEKDVESLAREFEQELHKVNPSLLIGMYPTPRDWVLQAMARGFGTGKMPMVIFATDTYKPRLISRMPTLPRQFYAKQNINAVYAAGFLLGYYGADTLEQQLLSATEKCSGYWLFSMQRLWHSSEVYGKLASGSRDEYWQVIDSANRHICALTNSKDR